MPWRTVEGKELAPASVLELETLMKGIFGKTRFLDLVRNFVVFEGDGSAIVKKLAGYHQFQAVKKAIDCAVRASQPEGDRRVGVVWHTQGSGKSLTMAFFAGKLIQHHALENPTRLDYLTQHTRETPPRVRSLRPELPSALDGIIFQALEKDPARRFANAREPLTPL